MESITYSKCTIKYLIKRADNSAIVEKAGHPVELATKVKLCLSLKMVLDSCVLVQNKNGCLL